MAEPEPQAVDPLEPAVPQAIAVYDGDVQAALKAALIASAFLETESSG